MNSIFDSLLAWSHSAEGLSLGLLFWCYCCITLFYRFYRVEGLIVYQIVALLVADIQVLCASDFAWAHHPVPLGTVIYTTLFLASDLMTEAVGAPQARRYLRLMILGHLLFFSFTLWTLAYPFPQGAETSFFLISRNAIETLFRPHMTIFLSSQIAYLISQSLDISVFAHIKRKVPQALALRSIVSVLIGVLSDALIFNVLAWRVLGAEQIAWSVLWRDYICFNTMIQLLILLLNVPVFYVILSPRSFSSRLSWLWIFLRNYAVPKRSFGTN